MDERTRKITVPPGASIKNVMEKLDASGLEIVFVVDDGESLLGVITDGDIRRWILKKGDLNEVASAIMTRKPVVIRHNYSSGDARELMRDKRRSCVPVVDETNRLVSALWWVDFFEDKAEKHGKINVPVVIMAGGKGTRLEPFTKVLPKALIPIGDRTIMEVIIDKFVRYGCADFFISVNYKSSVIKAYFNDAADPSYNITYLEETDYCGTAGSLCLLKGKIDGTFILNNCDVMIEADYSEILRFHRENKNDMTVICSMKEFRIPYGVVETDQTGGLNFIREKPEFNFLVNTGMYVIESGLIGCIPAGRVFHMNDFINSCKGSGKKIGVYPISEKSWTDIGQMDELFLTLKKFGAGRNE